jgi:hypothetical protein
MSAILAAIITPILNWISGKFGAFLSLWEKKKQISDDDKKVVEDAEANDKTDGFFNP